MKLNKTAAVCLSAVSFLAACGGGGGGGVVDGGGGGSGSAPAQQAPSTTAVNPANTGTITAPFAKAASARYVLIGVGAQITGTLTTAVQNTAGVMTDISGNTLSGSSTMTREISGDAQFAQGRWFAGTITTSAASRTLDGTTNESFHYTVFNNLTTVPTTGTKACGAGQFTSPSYTGGNAATASAFFGTTTGSATVTFDGTGAHPSMVINTTADNSSGTVTVSGTVATPTAFAVSGAFFGSGAGGVVTVADGGSGSIVVTGGYRVVLSNGRAYNGVATFRCS